METRRLIPYSVHLPEPLFKKLKAAAGERKASAMVRDAINILVDGTSTYNSGYNKGLRDAQAVIKANKSASGIEINGKNIGSALEAQIEKLVIKEKANGKKKT
jgi:hypothetical protein